MLYIFDIQYFGSVNYYFELIKSTNCKFELYDTYQKMSFRNRCRILGANGLIDLSIPVVGGREIKCRMNEVKICYKEDWRSRHFKTLVSSYNRSPWFDYYKDQFETLYSDKIEYLAEWDLKCHSLVSRVLNIKSINNYNLTLSYESDFEGSNKKVLDLRNKFLPKEPNPFEIKMKPYPQVFSDRYGFVPGLSILDLIFCEGPNALEILKGADRPA